ncbi:hypothetical protein KM043_001185 [Ampulex compressa]|nr:hypothetical protein KM043_001185 [Ampulex compressa]
MEDSYTVHRRRKAAARRREKTPDPSSRNQNLDTSEDEEGARRLRMEQMADDAERLEKENLVKQEEARLKLEEASSKEEKGIEDSTKLRVEAAPRKTSREASPRVNDPRSGEGSSEQEKRTSNVTSKIDEADLRKDPSKKEELVEVKLRPNKSKENLGDLNKSPEKSSKGKESLGELNKSPEKSSKAKESLDELNKSSEKSSKNKESLGELKSQEKPSRLKDSAIESPRTSEIRKLERRAKKKSKERVDRHSRSTDSSDMEDRSESRRTKSPEGARVRPKKSSSRIQKLSSTDPEAVKDTSSEKQLSSKQRPEEPDRAKERLATKAQAEGLQPKMKKSDTFPRRSSEEPSIRRSATDVKKQVIPISDESLIEDFAKAQREYLMRERSILDPDPVDDFQDASQESVLRRRKLSFSHTAEEHLEIIEKSKLAERTWFSWLPFWGKKKQDTKTEEKTTQQQLEEEDTTGQAMRKKESMEESSETLETSLVEIKGQPKVTLMDFFRGLKNFIVEFRAFVAQNPKETAIIRRLWNRCMSDLILLMIYCGLGALVFRFVEGAFETFYKCGVKRVKRDFLDSLWNYSHNMREEDWKSMARRKLMEFEEQLHTAHEAGVHTYSGQRSWSFLNAVVYCLTVITTIGYGHISPSTTTGRAITIVYAIFGIPMFLIILADFGKLFTRGIKFLWAFVRRLYYTGSCRKVRRTGPVQEVMKGVQLVYDLATFRRPSQMSPEDIEEMQRQAQQSQTVLNLDGNVPDTPGTPAMSAFAIDDEFNLPISVAIFILVGYIFIGALLYTLSEKWGFFESFYFVFISMSTIGFGDYVPKHPTYMVLSIIYLMFGLALTSMCINVVQVMLSDSFRQASQKIGATIGFEVAEDDGSVKPAIPPAVEVADVHMVIKDSESEEKIAPRAKQEDVDL